MKIWMQFVWRTFKVFTLFTLCTVFFYYGMIWVNKEYENYHRYDKPQGTAIKVSSQTENDRSSLIERLLFFYSHGE